MPYVRYHPVFLDLNGRPVLVVGGGAVAVEKIESLLPSGADITVVSPSVVPEIQAWHAEGAIRWVTKTFEDGDVEPAFMVIAATDDPVLNAHVFQTGNRGKRLSNSVDDPEHCNFIMAAITTRGPMQVAISSAGCSPALAQRIRNRIANEILTEETGELAEFLGDWRARIKETIPTYRHRKGFWERVLSSEVPSILAEKGRIDADLAMESALAWSSDHHDCLLCDCAAAGFECAKVAS